MIKNKVKQNIAFGIKEYKYLTDALKNEILILRGDLVKAGLPIHTINDKLVLQFLPNDMIGDGSTDNHNHNDEDDNLGVKNDLIKRQSIVGLSQNQLIIKYCELKAKFDTMKESAGRKISELANKTERMEDDDENATIVKLREELKEKDETIKMIVKKHDSDKLKISELEKNLHNVSRERVQLISEIESQKAENESNQEMLNLTMNDISELNEKLEKCKKKKKQYKSQMNKVNEDVNKFSIRINELYEKVNKEEYANKVYELKIQDQDRIIQDLNKKIEFMQEMEKNSKQGEGKLAEEISKLRDEAKDKIQIQIEKEYLFII
jgi:chromosome segregation ATPase